MLTPQNYMSTINFNKSDFDFWIPNKNTRMVRRLKKHKKLNA